MEWTNRSKQTKEEWFAEIATLAYKGEPIELKRQNGDYAGVLSNINKTQILSKTLTHNIKSSYESITSYRLYTVEKGEWKSYKYDNPLTDIEMSQSLRSTGLVIKLMNGKEYQVDKINKVSIHCHKGDIMGKVSTRAIAKYRSGQL